MQGFLKTFTLFLALVIGVAQASTTGSFSALIQDYHYKMTVEWDQRDQQFQAQALKEFKAGLEALKAEGLTENDLLNELEGSFKNPATAAQLKDLKVALQNGALTGNTFAERAMELAKADQMQGASWSGRSVIGWGIVAAITIAWVTWTLDVCRVEGCRWDGEYRNGERDFEF